MLSSPTQRRPAMSGILLIPDQAVNVTNAINDGNTPHHSYSESALAAHSLFRGLLFGAVREFTDVLSYATSTIAVSRKAPQRGPGWIRLSSPSTPPGLQRLSDPT